MTNTAKEYYSLVEIKMRWPCQESVTLSSVRDVLLPKLLSGEIRVKDAEKTVGAHI